MKSDHKEQGLEAIAALIQEEVEAAIAFFRARNFRERIERRLKEEAGGKKPVRRAPFRRVPALTGVLLICIAGGLFFIFKGPGSSPPAPQFKGLASALGRLPGFSNLPEREWMESQRPAGTSRLADSLRRALAAAEKIKRAEEQKISIPAGTGKVPRLSIEQRMEILFKERAVEHALLLFKDGSKEV